MKKKQSLKQESTLLGWDDGKVYYYDESNVERCVSDYPELLTRLLGTCKNYFKRHRTNRKKQPANASKR